MVEVTEILAAIQQGDPSATDQLLPLVYDELRAIAARKMNHEKPGQTLNPTGLVHEAYLRLVGDKVPAEWNSRGHFFAAAAEAMRRILVENARRKGSAKRGGRLTRKALDSAVAVYTEESAVDLLELNEALTRLGESDPDAAQLVKLRYFAGFALPDAAELMGISLRSANRLWAYARAWLYRALKSE